MFEIFNTASFRRRSQRSARHEDVSVNARANQEGGIFFCDMMKDEFMD